MKKHYVERLQRQLDTVRFGEWKKGTPRVEGEACAIYQGSARSAIKLHRPITKIMAKILNDRGAISQGLYNWHDESLIMRWNDNDAKKNDVIELLDETLKVAKEKLDEAGTY